MREKLLYGLVEPRAGTDGGMEVDVMSSESLHVLSSDEQIADVEEMDLPERASGTPQLWSGPSTGDVRA